MADTFENKIFVDHVVPVSKGQAKTTVPLCDTLDNLTERPGTAMDKYHYDDLRYGTPDEGRKR